MNKSFLAAIAALLISVAAMVIGAVNMRSYNSLDKESIVYMEGINTLTQQEIEEGWISLFNGENFEGWRGYNSASFPDSGWIVDNGTIQCTGKRGGDIICDRKFSDFHLKMEWKVFAGGNSGIFYRVKEVPGQPMYMSGPEMQVLDNDRHPDAKRGKDGNRTAGSLYDLITALPHSAKPAGEWNQVEIIVENSHVTHYLNNNKVVEYQLDSPEFAQLVSESKFGESADFARSSEGFIGIQDHNNLVWFRNIKIREL